MSQLPLSQQSLNMAFHVLDKDRDGLISAAEAYKMVAFYLVRRPQLQESSSAVHVMHADLAAHC
jgi:Ca2+-binding EF-hand superfamily protein